ncbi:MAG: pyridoxal phosphate-dependent aminotransferase, partial [Candidatus Omnitrophica bacterium]|nr:pyridoxal phosphate-dependent aminotransferase [Candidatus Omnitrophota bacterium]
KGLEKARNAICEYYREQGLKVNPENIFLTAGTSEAYSHLFRLLLNLKEEVLLPQPSYPLFQYIVDLNDARFYPYTLQYNNGWALDLEALSESNFSAAKAIVLVNPNNPTGSYIKTHELDIINQICHQHNMAVICDEVFYDFDLGIEPDRVSLVNNSEVLTFVLSGISKILGLPQMKLSWIVVNGPDLLVKEAMKRLEVISDTYLSVNTPVQNALAYWLKEKEMLQKDIKERIQQNYDFLQKQIHSVKATQLLKAEGGWYAILRIPAIRSEDEWVIKLLTHYHVFVHPGYFFDFDEGVHFILSLLTDSKVFQEGVMRILSRVEQEVS